MIYVIIKYRTINNKRLYTLYLNYIRMYQMIYVISKIMSYKFHKRKTAELISLIFASNSHK